MSQQPAACPPLPNAPEDYDADHAAVHSSPLIHRLWAEAMGDQYPHEVEPFSSCTWWLLGHLLAELRLRPGTRLVDLGCGRGGPGLFLARACSARLVGVDFSPVAVRLATERAGAFVPDGHAQFRHGTFERTGLPDEYADGVISVDALPFAEDRVAALREARRILVPHGRLVLTVREPLPGQPDWAIMAADAGLTVERSLVNPGCTQIWHRLFALWLANADQLMAELGRRAATNLLDEARLAASRADQREHLLLVMRRP